MDDNSLKIAVAAVNKAFYDRLYKDPWLKEVFRNVEQKFIESQQSDFMVGSLGGPKKYGGRSPADAHPHIFVDEEMWQLREVYLKEAFAETKFPEELAKKWLRIDEAFKHAIVKKSPSDCKKRFTMDEIVVVPNTLYRKAG